MGATSAATLVLASPPAKAGGGWEGCPRFAMIRKIPLPSPPPAFAGRGQNLGPPGCGRWVSLRSTHPTNRYSPACVRASGPKRPAPATERMEAADLRQSPAMPYPSGKARGFRRSSKLPGDRPPEHPASRPLRRRSGRVAISAICPQIGGSLRSPVRSRFRRPPPPRFQGPHTRWRWTPSAFAEPVPTT